ncbi:MAG TPA: CcdB family protein [Allosphingosinicella sp.]|jgi:toxin CcdB
MARFDVYRLGGGYVLDCQTNAFSGLDTRFVAPLIPIGEVPQVRGLNPVFEVGGERLVMATQFAGPVPARRLKSRIASLEEQDHVILNAFDMLLTGY